RSHALLCAGTPGAAWPTASAMVKGFPADRTNRRAYLLSRPATLLRPQAAGPRRSAASLCSRTASPLVRRRPAPNAMRLMFLTDKPAWATIKAAAIRAYAPTQQERIIANSGLSQGDRQLLRQALARKEAGLVNAEKGTQLTYDAAGNPVQRAIPGAAEAESQMAAAKAAAQKEAEASGGYPQKLHEEAQHATGMLRTISE